MAETFGRRKILAPVAEVTRENLIDVLTFCRPLFRRNANEERYLYDYYRGLQDIRFKKQERYENVNHKATENRFYQFCEFWTGTMVGDPVIYTTAEKADDKADDIFTLNRYMRLAGKETADKTLFDWMHITGHGYTMVFPKPSGSFITGVEAPFVYDVLEPMRTMVVYADTPVRRKLLAAYSTKKVKPDGAKYIETTIFTPERRFVVHDWKEIAEEDYNYIGVIPIFEWSLNLANLGVAEPTISLLDKINSLDSDRLDAVTAFVKSILLAINVEIEDGTTKADVLESGILNFESDPGKPGEVKFLEQQLDQTQNQTLKDDLYNAALQIVGMPSQSKGDTSDSSNNGATFLKTGYQITEMRAKSEENMYKWCAKEQTDLILMLCEDTGLSLDPADVTITFTRHAYSDALTKANVFTALMGSTYADPRDVWNIAALLPEPEAAALRGIEWHKKVADEKKVDGGGGTGEEDTGDNYVKGYYR